jgi:hypothetical protein
MHASGGGGKWCARRVVRKISKVVNFGNHCFAYEENGKEKIMEGLGDLFFFI